MLSLFIRNIEIKITQPKIEYDDNGIGKVTFDFTDDGTRNVSFKWQHETGTTGAGRYHFVWTFVGDNPACEQTLEWDVFVQSWYTTPAIRRSTPRVFWNRSIVPHSS